MAVHSQSGGPFTGLSLCAGYGGLELGLAIAEPGYRTVCFVEREAHAAATLVARMADQALDQAPVWSDLKSFDGRAWRGKVHILTAGYDCACNWKILMDAFAENYHFVSVHRGTVGLPGPKCAVEHRGTVMALYENGHSRNILPWNDGFEPRESASEETGFSMGMGGIADIESVGPIPRTFITAFTCFPNLTTPVYANGFPLLLFWPTGINTSRMDVVWMGMPHGQTELPDAWKEKIAQFNVILDEDLTYLPSVQKSAESPAFRSVLVNYQERRIYHAHEQIDRVIGPDLIPPHLRVEPVLAGAIE